MSPDWIIVSIITIQMSTLQTVAYHAESAARIKGELINCISSYLLIVCSTYMYGTVLNSLKDSETIIGWCCTTSPAMVYSKSLWNLDYNVHTHVPTIGCMWELKLFRCYTSTLQHQYQYTLQPTHKHMLVCVGAEKSVVRKWMFAAGAGPCGTEGRYIPIPIPRPRISVLLSWWNWWWGCCCPHR